MNVSVMFDVNKYASLQMGAGTSTSMISMPVVEKEMQDDLRELSGEVYLNPEANERFAAVRTGAANVVVAEPHHQAAYQASSSLVLFCCRREKVGGIKAHTQTHTNK